MSKITQTIDTTEAKKKITKELDFLGNNASVKYITALTLKNFFPQTRLCDLMPLQRNPVLSSRARLVFVLHVCDIYILMEEIIIDIHA